ncbi:MAG: hypothetical protein AB7S77_19280 [Desulfatirhabdiaceae bacterium]
MTWKATAMQLRNRPFWGKKTPNRIDEFNEFITRLLYLDIMEVVLFNGKPPETPQVVTMLEKYQMPVTGENVETVTIYAGQIITSIRKIVASGLMDDD